MALGFGGPGWIRLCLVHGFLLQEATRHLEHVGRAGQDPNTKKNLQQQHLKNHQDSSSVFLNMVINYKYNTPPEPYSKHRSPP